LVFVLVFAFGVTFGVEDGSVIRGIDEQVSFESRERKWFFFGFASGPALGTPPLVGWRSAQADWEFLLVACGGAVVEVGTVVVTFSTALGVIPLNP
jgi:hypothetical protein